MQTFRSISFARLLEQIEIVRSGLRWATTLDRSGISRILHQVNKLRSEILMHASVEKIKTRKSQKRIKNHTADRERRQALLDRSFVFEGVFGENPKYSPEAGQFLSARPQAHTWRAGTGGSDELSSLH